MCVAGLDHPLYLSQVGGGWGVLAQSSGGGKVTLVWQQGLVNKESFGGICFCKLNPPHWTSTTGLGGGGGMLAERLTVGSRPCVNACVTGERRVRDTAASTPARVIFWFAGCNTDFAAEVGGFSCRVYSLMRSLCSPALVTRISTSTLPRHQRKCPCALPLLTAATATADCCLMLLLIAAAICRSSGC